MTSNRDRPDLERCAQWLLSIPREDQVALRFQPEYDNLLVAIQNLENAHQKLMNTKAHNKSSFLHFLCDEVIIRILEFLPCVSLLRISETCHRLHSLAYVSAYRRTRNLSLYQYLNGTTGETTPSSYSIFSDACSRMSSVMKLLRANEEMCGIQPNDKPFVRIPLFGLSRRVIVTGSGDDEFNGTYFCTGFNGNGFVFSKPRFSSVNRTDELRVVDLDDDNILEESDSDNETNSGLVVPIEHVNEEKNILRCIIARRYSHDVLLWYMSKELYRKPDGHVGSSFIFWANLMISNDNVEFQYPSLNGWQSLIDSIQPPTVELS